MSGGNGTTHRWLDGYVRYHHPMSCEACYAPKALTLGIWMLVDYRGTDASLRRQRDVTVAVPERRLQHILITCNDWLAT